jgi:hypothetical protein
VHWNQPSPSLSGRREWSSEGVGGAQDVFRVVSGQGQVGARAAQWAVSGHAGHMREPSYPILPLCTEHQHHMSVCAAFASGVC